jgi:two-component sensor histidine kinase
LQPATAQTLAPALHELVTNSAQYGALSTLAGQLSITWQVQANNLALSWKKPADFWSASAKFGDPEPEV